MRHLNKDVQQTETLDWHSEKMELETVMCGLPACCGNEAWGLGEITQERGEGGLSLSLRDSLCINGWLEEDMPTPGKPKKELACKGNGAREELCFKTSPWHQRVL